ncbi:MAG TPA: hypothetical protein VHE55_13185 [Fimbriimonadaceae bacterium]|nr:hypothetical protein [Fimbriimonadaceae bacterium]
MLALVALAVMAPAELRLPRMARCPDAILDGKSVCVAYGDGTNGWFFRTGGERRIRINSEDGTVTAGGERGPKVAVAEEAICAAWQGDYRQGPKVWFARSLDKGKSFEAQRNLVDGETPGLDEVAIAARGKQVAVFWLDGRGGQDASAPVTSTIWYCLSTDSGKTFGPNKQMGSSRTESPRTLCGLSARAPVRACSCCSLAVEFLDDDRIAILYRSGIGNVRDIWEATGSPAANTWEAKPVTNSGWVFAGCPMDGPRMHGSARAYSIDGSCYAVLGAEKPVRLGKGKYASVLPTGLATWQDDGTLYWRNLKSGENGLMPAGSNRAALIAGPEGYPLVVH